MHIFLSQKLFPANRNHKKKKKDRKSGVIHENPLPLEKKTITETKIKNCHRRMQIEKRLETCNFQRCTLNKTSR